MNTITQGSSLVQNAAQTQAQTKSDRSAPFVTLPAELPASKVEISPEARRLAALEAVNKAPVAVAAVSQNDNVDAFATTLYTAEQAQKAVEQYATVYQSTSENYGVNEKT